MHFRVKRFCPGVVIADIMRNMLMCNFFPQRRYRTSDIQDDSLFFTRTHPLQATHSQIQCEQKLTRIVLSPYFLFTEGNFSAKDIIFCFSRTGVDTAFAVPFITKSWR